MRDFGFCFQMQCVCDFTLWYSKGAFLKVHSIRFSTPKLKIPENDKNNDLFLTRCKFTIISKQ